jgi:23S rRNA (cytidine1920-2'-O)/16S rRNA (cytidine1409-2'-O)-methyltransferase
MAEEKFVEKRGVTLVTFCQRGASAFCTASSACCIDSPQIIQTVKTRLDKLLVDRGLTPSRERAQALILAGKVLVNNQKVEKAGAAIDADSALRLLGDDLRYVSRGGLKLEKAIAHWQIDLRSKVCLDVGASTGGFSDCMLQHGAAKVIAVDTGYGQMDFGLRKDPRIQLLEKTNARYLKAGDLQFHDLRLDDAEPDGLQSDDLDYGDRGLDDTSQAIAFVAVDVSFISATLVLPAVIHAAFGDSHAAETTRQIVVLVKPQFEVGRELVGKGGIVRDEAAQRAAVAKLEAALVKLGARSAEWIESPILGGEGNREFLLHGEFSTTACS